MKYLVVLFLFLFFAACISGVRYADSYSAQYKNCTANLMKLAKQSKEYPTERAALHADILKNEPSFLSGAPCPALRPDHKSRLIAVLGP